MRVTMMCVDVTTCDSKRTCKDTPNGRMCGDCPNGWTNDGATGCKGFVHAAAWFLCQGSQCRIFILEKFSFGNWDYFKVFNFFC